MRPTRRSFFVAVTTIGRTGRDLRSSGTLAGMCCDQEALRWLITGDPKMRPEGVSGSNEELEGTTSAADARACNSRRRMRQGGAGYSFPRREHAMGRRSFRALAYLASRGASALEMKGRGDGDGLHASCSRGRYFRDVYLGCNWISDIRRPESARDCSG